MTVNSFLDMKSQFEQSGLSHASVRNKTNREEVRVSPSSRSRYGSMEPAADCGRAPGRDKTKAYITLSRTFVVRDVAGPVGFNSGSAPDRRETKERCRAMSLEDSETVHQTVLEDVGPP
ncbi:unnamed protein product [Pleuronectes platessa]|uniref:Uncharacterized protein n=1 Tax=Pleuronectes platessa TaxID=8262 RepID=A0A9N7Z6U6_PLEPL|nr:unnamed protein product [Pleuronectes platessa]